MGIVLVFDPNSSHEAPLGRLGDQRIEHVVDNLPPFDRWLSPMLAAGGSTWAAPLKKLPIQSVADFEAAGGGSIAAADDWLDHKIGSLCKGSPGDYTVLIADPAARPNLEFPDVNGTEFIREEIGECIYYTCSGSSWSTGSSARARGAIISFDYFGFVVQHSTSMIQLARAGPDAPAALLLS